MKRLSLVLMLAFASFTAMVAQRSISGTITDENGEALIGATILVKGTTTGAVTDIDGSYTLSVPAGSNTLVFSYTGYGTQEIQLGASNVLDVQMGPDAQLLNEVVVTGYSEIERKKLISSVAVVDDAAIENIPLTDVNQLVQGRAPGVYTTANSGQPGAQQQIRIRGTGSITGGRNPLYVIDGVPIENGNFAQRDGGNNATDILANLNPNDIANITILKDASATALYGSRGANGVVLITTKRGKAGKTEVTIKGQYGSTQPLSGNFQMMNAQQFIDYERQVLINSGRTPAEAAEIRPNTGNETDWVDAAFRDGLTYNIEAQARGGNDKTRFFGSVGYFDQEGTQIETQFDRISARLNVDHFASDKLDFSMNFNATYTQQNNAVNGNRFQSPMLGAFINRPDISAINPATGELYTGLEDDWGAVFSENFLYSFPINYVNINQFRMLGKLGMNYNLTKNLRFTQNVNIDWITIDEVDWDDPTTNDGEANGGDLAQSFNNRRTLTTQSLLKYFNDIGANSSIDVLAGFEYQRTRGVSFDAFGKGFASGKLQTLNSAAEANGAPDGDNTAYSFVSVLAQANYTFKERYGLQVSARRDGSSRFGANNRWATFWSVGGSWNISQEPFMEGGFFDNLRLRVSYGTSGNANIGNFPSQELYGFGASYANFPGSSPAQIGNPDLTWEKNENGNIGLDFAILNSRIGGTFEVYRRVSTDLLLNVPVSSTSGFTTATQNIGEMENYGLEITLFASPIKSATPGGFNWNTDFNISWNRNEILALPDGEDIINGSQLYREGKPIRGFFVREWAGVNPADGTPLWYSNREESDATTGSYNSAARRAIFNAEPDFIAGWTNTFTFKGISLSAFLYAAQGHQIYNSSRRFIESDGQRLGWNHIVEAAEDTWQNPGDQVSRPQPLPGGNNASNSFSTRYIEDASFIRLRNITLGYSLPKSLTDRLNLSRVSLYVQGVNLWTATDYSGFDPEADEDGVEFFRFPVGKSITFGMDVTF